MLLYVHKYFWTFQYLYENPLNCFTFITPVICICRKVPQHINVCIIYIIYTMCTLCCIMQHGVQKIALAQQQNLLFSRMCLVPCFPFPFWTIQSKLYTLYLVNIPVVVAARLLLSSVFHNKTRMKTTNTKEHELSCYIIPLKLCIKWCLPLAKTMSLCLSTDHMLVFFQENIEWFKVESFSSGISV